jgi:hypothetical protein
MPWIQVAGLPYQLAALFSGCPDPGGKLLYLRDILDLDPQLAATDSTQQQAAVTWDAAAWCSRHAAAQHNPLTARYFASLLTKELAERCESLK